MAEIENLNFEVILQDKDFRKRVDEDIKIAQDLNVKLSDALNFNKKVSIDSLKRVTAETKNMTKEMDKFNKSASKDVKKSVTEIGRMNSSLATSGNLMRTLGQLTGVAFSVVGLRRFLSTLIDVTGQFEVQKMALRNMLQDIDAADKIFEDLYSFSSQSTYRFSELAKYAKQLAAFNIDKNNLLETTKMLGDVASGVGVSMDRLILAYGHVKSSGFLRGIQLRSFSQNGVPILEELSKMFTEIEGKAVSLGDVFDKMMKREIGFDMVEEAFRRMTSEGGKFYQMQEVLAKTLAGQINILKGKWENLMYAIGESQEGVLKGVVQSLTKIVSNMENFGRVLKEAVAILGAYRAAMITSVAVTEGLASAINVSLVGRAFKNLWAVIAKNPYATLAAGAALLIAEVIKANNALSDSEKITDAVTKSVSKYEAALASESAEMERLYTKLRLAKEGTEEYDKAKLAIENRFGSYLQQIRAENTQITNLADTYQLLADKIREAQKAKFLESSSGEVQGAFESATNNIYESFKKTAEVNKWSIGQQEDIWRYIITGQLSDQSNFNQLSRMGGGTIGVPGTFLYKDLGRSADSLRSSYLSAAKAFDDGMTALEAAFDSHKGAISGSEGSPDQQVIKLSSIVEGIKNIDRELTKLRNKAKSSGGITEEEQKQIEALTEDREEQTKLYKSIMGDNYDKSVKSSQTEQNKAIKDRITSLKSEISVLEKYRDAREKLEPFFGGDTDAQLASIFGDSRDYSTLDADISSLCESLRKLGTEGVEAAEQIEARLGLDKTSSIIKAQKALQKWQTTLRKWTKDWGGGDFHGIEGDIDKVIRDYNNEDEEITQDYIDSLNEIMEAHWGDAEAIKKEVDALDALVAARRAANSTTQQEKLNDLASKYVKENLNSKKLDLHDWGDKSIGQVREIYRALVELANGEVVLDEITKGRLESAGLKIEDFSKLAKEEFEQLSENARQELVKKFCNTLKEVVGELDSVANAIKDLADASGNNGLSVAMEAISFDLTSLATFAEKAATGDWIGAIVGFAASLATAFFRARAEVARFNASLRAARETARRDNLLDSLGSDSIFGESGIRKARYAVDVMQKARASMNAAVGPKSFNRKETLWDSLGMTGRKLTYTLAELADSVGRDLYDAYGNLNAETLNVILDTYTDLGTAEQEWIRRAINDSEVYAEAMEQLRDVVSSVFGDIASSAADAIVDQWINAGNAALNYADILDDVARRYAKMAIEGAILDQVLNEDQAKSIVAKFANGDAEGAMAQIASDMEQIAGMQPVFEQILTAFDPYFNRAGSESASNSLAAGINKELVEGNSSLLASYINAMRADLSVIRGLQSGGWQDIRVIREYAPTYADYMARIEANTFDNAQAAQSILARLQSIITPSTNGGSAVRTTR